MDRIAGILLAILGSLGFRLPAEACSVGSTVALPVAIPGASRLSIRSAGSTSSSVVERILTAADSLYGVHDRTRFPSNGPTDSCRLGAARGRPWTARFGAG